MGFCRLVVLLLVACTDPGTTMSPQGDSPPELRAGGIWIGSDDIARLATSGPAWEALLRVALANPGVADLSDQNSDHDTHTLASALVCVRTGSGPQCDRARRGVLAAVGTEKGARWLAVGRNLTAYAIAADLLGMRADGDPVSAGSRVQEWLAGFLTLELADNITGEPRPFPYFDSGSNAAAQQGAAYAAVAAYLNDHAAVRRAWEAFRVYACDPGVRDAAVIDLRRGVEYGWAHDEARPCAVNPAGSTKQVPSGVAGAGQVRRIDGAIINDMRRGGHFQWEPGYTQYPWVGLEGFVPAAVILHRAGYPAFEVADRAVLRAAEYLWYLRVETGDLRWFDGDRAAEVVQLINRFYGTKFPVRSGIGGGRTVGFTDWTHPEER